MFVLNMFPWDCFCPCCWGVAGEAFCWLYQPLGANLFPASWYPRMGTPNIPYSSMKKCHETYGGNHQYQYQNKVPWKNEVWLVVFWRPRVKTRRESLLFDPIDCQSSAAGYGSTTWEILRMWKLLSCSLLVLKHSIFLCLRTWPIPILGGGWLNGNVLRGYIE